MQMGRSDARVTVRSRRGTDDGIKMVSSQEDMADWARGSQVLYACAHAYATCLSRVLSPVVDVRNVQDRRGCETLEGLVGGVGGATQGFCHCSG